MLNSIDFVRETKEIWSSVYENEEMTESEASEIISAWFEYLMLIQEFVENKRHY